MPDYRLTKCENGWLVRLDDRASGAEQYWIAHTAAEAGEIIGREEGEITGMSLADIMRRPDIETGESQEPARD